MTSFIDPLSPDKAKGVAYQLVNSMFAIARGGVTGRGFMRSVQKFIHFPAQENDFVFAIFSEEFGLVGVTLILGLYLWIVFALFQLAARASEPFARVYAMSLGVFIAVQTMVNIGVVVGLLPTTGVPLPFFSQGATTSSSRWQHWALPEPSPEARRLFHNAVCHRRRRYRGAHLPSGGAGRATGRCRPGCDAGETVKHGGTRLS